MNGLTVESTYLGLGSDVVRNTDGAVLSAGDSLAIRSDGDYSDGDNHLTLDEANQHARWGQGRDVWVDASRLSFEITGPGNKPGRFAGRVTGNDWYVHGSGTANLRSNGTYGIFDGQYNFEQHENSYNPITGARNIATRIGRATATKFGREPTDYWIRYEGNVNIFTPTPLPRLPRG